MIVEDQIDLDAAKIAAAIGEPARARILYSLMDGHARTSTELAVIADVTPSTASVHLHRLTFQRLITVVAQGKHRYYSLRGPAVARVLESLEVLAGEPRIEVVTTTPRRLRAARTCYDHMAGRAAVAMRERLFALGWLSDLSEDEGAYDLSAKGVKALELLGIDVAATQASRRRFAYGCMDWSERRPHIAGALGAALLKVLLEQGWVAQHHDSRALSVTRLGYRELHTRLGAFLDPGDVDS